MSRLGRLCLLVALLTVVAVPPAHAHQRADLSIVAPAEGEVVSGKTLQVVIAATGGELTQADFAVELNGRPVDTSGAVREGSLFTTFSLRAGEQKRVRVTLPGPGDHELRLVYARDADDPRPDVVRRFRTDGAGGGRSAAVPFVIAVGAATAVLGAAVARRRRRTS